MMLSPSALACSDGSLVPVEDTVPPSPTAAFAVPLGRPLPLPRPRPLPTPLAAPEAVFLGAKYEDAFCFGTAGLPVDFACRVTGSNRILACVEPTNETLSALPVSGSTV